MIHKRIAFAVVIAIAATASGCREPKTEAVGHPAPPVATTSQEADMNAKSNSTADREVATFGAGCFWCSEAVLEQLDGVLDVVSGYMGGHVPNPTYEQVCTKKTGHAEVVQVTFDPKKLSYGRLLDWFWSMHDPTSLNRQGNDTGPQYRSVIFYHSDEQERLARESKAKLDASGRFTRPIVTEIAPAGPFYPAEDYHQNYYRLNKFQGYCRYVIAPKLKKLHLKD